MADILVVGAGPVGLTLAGELARHGARCRIIDRLPAPSPYCRAIGVTPRTLEVWDDMGVAREMIEAGLWITGMRSIIQGRPAMDTHEDYSFLPYAHLGLPQDETERVLTRHLGRAGIAVERGVTLTGLRQQAGGVAVRLAHANGTTEEAAFRYVVGCDGAHSSVRHALGISFEGEAMPMTFMLGDVRIAWDLPYGMSLRALRLNEAAPPDLFVAVPLPERGRYRVSMVAPDRLVPAGGTGHGIQAEMPGPSIEDLQAVANDLLPDRPRLSGMRWSSMFRISMRLATRYRDGHVFIAGDAAHIHPPTGGQGMNTGIQDAYNLAWKLALVLNGAAPESLLDSYEAERRPVGAEVIARTRAATEGYGRESGKQDRLADTQILVSYRGSGWVQDGAGYDGPVAGDRAPDADGLRQRGVGFPLRLQDALRGTEHVLVAYLPGGDPAPALNDLAAFAQEARSRLDGRLRVTAVTAVADLDEHPHLTLFHDARGRFAEAYGNREASFLVRPDGYLGWRGGSWRDDGLREHLGSALRRAACLGGPGPFTGAAPGISP
ncbi:FAD-dependent monooxygenase [Roseomonas xinghualingensis]|uniref:FAD-dependent monooxygenase n=1 Tax=Roseomonas xinghualingensis TaxID=2986475 RepID=UPI0021F1FB12|nr:FAD-dependent monooxygenase [Roseomonas sp. SXEYE001]MCV4207819.1 FAD-dependent monooxygenase [Roseomonas sp. SXEYE001]